MPNPPRDEQCQVGKCKREYEFTYYGKRICLYCWEKYAERREKLFELLKLPKSKLVAVKPAESPISSPVAESTADAGMEIDIDMPDLFADCE